jgi:uncharacterized protein
MDSRILRLSKVSALGVLISVTLPAQAEQQKTIVELTQTNRTIATQGEFESRVTPDKVTVVFLVKTFDKLVPAVYASNSQIAQKLVGLAPAMGVSKSDVQTSEITMEPQYRYAQGYGQTQGYELDRYKPIGYICSRSVSFVLKDVSKLASLLKSGLQNGANGIEAVSFECTEAPKYRAKARILALKAAREKAVEMAEAVGCKVGRPMNITEGYSSSYNLSGTAPALSGATNGTIGPQGQDAAFVTGVSQGLEIGQLIIKSDVSATFELE